MMRVFVAALFFVSIVGAGCNGATDGPSIDCPDEMPKPSLDDILDEYGVDPTVEVRTNRGTFTVEVYPTVVPVTGTNFLRLADCGFFDRVKFHRVIDGFMIQGGDPNTKDDSAQGTWGRGGPGYAIVDEFHSTLRHDSAGVLSMANSGANSGGSQFFVTLGPTPGLDDQHAVFGRVVDGMDVVRAIGSTPTDVEDRPTAPVVIQSTRVVRGSDDYGTTPPRLAAVLPTLEVPAGGQAAALLLADAGDDVLVYGAVEARVGDGAPEGATAVPGDGADDVDAFAGRKAAFEVTVQVPADAEPGTTFPVVVTLSSDGGNATVVLTVEVGPQVSGRAAQSGDGVTANYVGFTEFGELFDTSLHAVASNASIPKFQPTFRLRGGPDAYQPFGFAIDGQVISGFSDGARGLRAGESNIVIIAPQDAYGAGASRQSALSGWTLVFWIGVQSVG